MENKNLVLNIEESTLDDCQGCQEEEGRKITGLKTHKSIPVDTRHVKVEFLNSSDAPLYIKHCPDCLVKAKIDGCQVKMNGEDWNGSGVGTFLYHTPEQLKEIFS